MGIADLLKESQGATAAFNDNSQPGDSVMGTVVSALEKPVFVYRPPGAVGPKVLDTWDDGNPKKQIVVTVQTDLRNPADPEDDGTRSIYIKWWGLSKAALLAAVSAAKADDILPSGKFYARYEGLGQKQPGINAPKIYRYQYQPPSGTAGLFSAAPADPFAASASTGNGHSAQPAAVPQQWVTPTAANVGTLGQATPEGLAALEAMTRPAPVAPAPTNHDLVAVAKQVRELNAMGVPLATIMTMTNLDSATVAAVLVAPTA